MTSIPRPGLEEAARDWLETSTSHHPGIDKVRTALTDFVDKRFRGAAPRLRRVHDLRLRLLADERPLKEVGTGDSIPTDRASLGRAAADSAPSDQGRLLFHLARAFSPATVLEMGTNIGISAAYIALGLEYGDGGRLSTIEASEVRLDLARGFLDDLEIQNVDLVEGYFDDVLPDLLDRLEGVDVAFVDGNHRLEPTLRYFEQLRGHLPAGGLVVLDDIRWSEEMLEAWNSILASPEMDEVIDLGRTGLVLLA